MRYVKTLKTSRFLHGILDYLKLHLILMGILVQLLTEMRVFVRYVIIIYQNWTIYAYLDLVLKGIVRNILYKSPHFGEEIVYVIKYY